MYSQERCFAFGSSALLLAVLAVGPIYAGGFSVWEQSAHAMGLGGAFTAQSKAPSSLFYNLGGAAFFEEKAFAVGAVARSATGLSFEAQPDVGIDTLFEQQDQAPLLAHAYTVIPIRPYLNFGLGVSQPFAHDVDWGDADSFPGRTVSSSSQIDTLDVNPSITLRFTKGIGIGIGAIYRTSTLALTRRLQTVDPLSGRIVDFASLDLNSGQQDGFGWNFGLLHRASERFSWGLSYRSAIDVDVTEAASQLTPVPTGNLALDDLLALSNPFGQDLPTTSSIAFPETASLGIQLGSAQRLLLAFDVTWTGWSSFQQLVIDIPGFPLYSQTIDQGFVDTYTFRFGAQLRVGGDTDLRLGYVVDESPQPDATVGPFLYDADRSTLSFGVGKDWLDGALSWTQFKDRAGATLAGNFTGDMYLLSVTVKKKPEL